MRRVCRPAPDQLLREFFDIFAMLDVPEHEHKAELSIRFQGELRFVAVQVTCLATHAQVCRNAHLVPGTGADIAYCRNDQVLSPTTTQTTLWSQ